MSASGRKKKISFARSLAIILPGILVILGIATAAFFFLRYRASVKLHASANPSLVRISQPVNMAQFMAGVPIQVQVNAAGQSPFTTVELWINGVLEGVQVVPGGGRASTSAMFWWIPPDEGNYALVGRAIDETNGSASSQAVIVFVSQSENQNQPTAEADRANPAVLPAPSEEYSSPEMPAGDEITPADEWQGSPGDWLNSLTSDSPPAAPELAVTAEGCNVKLDIHDLSENEEGFSVYRQTTNSQAWVHVTDLASHPGQDWIEYQDTNLSGGITYYITAFNSQGETSSNLALANIDPTPCPPPEPPYRLPVLHLKVKNLNIAENNAKIYCYSSLNSGQWSRWPEAGFLVGGENMQAIPLLVNPLILANLDDEGVPPETQPLDLELECWGWLAGKLKLLGGFAEKIDLESPIEHHAAFEEADFDISPEIISGAKINTFQLGDNLPQLAGGYENIYDVEELGFLPESSQMPLLHAELSYQPNDCFDSISMGPAKDDELCFPLPGFDYGSNGPNPQPYIVWDVISDSLCGARPEGYPCLSLDWWKGFTAANPDPYDPGIQWYLDYSIFYNDVYSGSEGWPYDIRQQAWRIDPDFPTISEQLCGNGYEIISVYLVARTSYGVIRSAPSNEVAVPCPYSKPDEVDIQVTWNTLTLNGIDDGYNNDLTEDHTAEAYGVFYTTLNQYGARSLSLQMGYSTRAEGVEVPPGVDHYYELNDGAYDIAGFRLALVQYQMNECQDSSCYATNHNIVTYTVHDRDQLILGVAMWDYDEHSDHDNICFGQLYIGSRSIYEWAETSNEHYDLIYPEGMGDATCVVGVTLNALFPSP
jgi:hypothetical protein